MPLHQSLKCVLRWRRRDVASVRVKRCRAGVGGQIDALLIHAFGLRAQDEAEEVFIRDGGASCRGRRRSAPLVIKSGTLGYKTCLYNQALNRVVFN